MIAPWMVYALAIASGAAVAALVAERALGALGRSRRWVWALSIAVSALAPIALPVWAVLSAAPPSPPEVQQAYTITSVTNAPQALPAAPVLEAPAPVDWRALLDVVLAWGWALATAAGLTLLLGSAVSLRAMRERWLRRRVSGVHVLISASTGPAVVGCFAPTIVVPEWVLELPTDKRRLILAHEREHADARDPLLLAAARLVATLLPWNLPIWWQLRRLQLAVEVDCDRRVLATADDVGLYGTLLLEVGSRSRRSWSPAPAFSQPASFLEQRIRDMTAIQPRNRSIQTAALAALLIAAPMALYAAPVVSHPALARLGLRLVERQEPSSEALSGRTTPPTRESGPQEVGDEASFRIVAFAAAPTPRPALADTVPDGIGGFAHRVAGLQTLPQLSNAGSISAIMERLYPRLLHDAGIGGTVTARLVIERDGTPNMRTFRILESDNPQLSEATLKVAERFRFRPGRLNGEIVRVLIDMPITWQPKADPEASAVGYRARGDAPERTATSADFFGIPQSELAALRETLAQSGSIESGSERRPATTNRAILERAKILVAQRYPSLLADTRGGTTTLFVIVAPDGEIRESRLVRQGEDFSWPAGTPTEFRKVTAIRDGLSLEFAPALVGSGIIWMEL